MLTTRRFTGLLVAGLSLAATASAQGNLIGLEARGARIVSFDVGSPGTLQSSTPITGLAPFETLVGIDVRPSTGELVGISTFSRVYVIDPATGIAIPNGAGPFSPILNGRAIGLDFNPVPDRLRVVTNADQSLRLNADTGAVVLQDTSLAYVAGDVAVGVNPSVAACAYTNAFAGATLTTLFGIDSNRDTLVMVGGPNGTPSPNGGQLTTIGSLGVDTTGFVGMDVSPFGGAFAVMNLSGESVSKVYTLNLATGAATLQGTIGGSTRVRDIAVRAPVQPRMYGATAGNRLVSFNAGRPGVLLADVAITGLAPTETIEGLDVRPATGDLLALSSASIVYRIDRTTGAATAVGGSFTPALAGTAFGFDFNPIPDRIRNVSNMGQNLRLNPNTGAIAGTDTSVAYAIGDAGFGIAPSIAGAAYTNNFAATTSTTLYCIDAARDVLVLQGSIGGTPNSPNSGSLTTVGALGTDTSDSVGFDITPFGGAFASFTAPAGASSSLATVNLATGAMSNVLPIAGAPLRALAADHPSVSRALALSTTNQLVSFAIGTPAATTTVNITGLQSGETLLGIDARPATGGIVGVGSTNQLYSINRMTGVAIAIGVPFTPTLVGSGVGVDFNPTVDRVRLVTESGQNLRLNPNTGALAMADTNLAYAAGDVNAAAIPREVAVAYDRNFGGATQTTMFGIDSSLDILVTQGSVNANPTSPNSGSLLTVGALGVDTGDLAGFDITAFGGAFLALTPTGGSSSTLYSVNTSTGATTSLGAIGGGAVRDVVILPAGL